MNDIGRNKRIGGHLRSRMSGTAALAFSATIIFGACAHLFRWSNAFYSDDSLKYMVQNPDLEYGLGRFLQSVYVFFRGDITSPFLIGVLGLSFLACAVMLVVKIFKFETAIAIIAIAGFMSTNATVTLINATYITWFDIYMLALLLSCASVFVALRYKWGILLSPILLAASMGLYQSYCQVVLVLSLVYAMKTVLVGDGAKSALLILLRMASVFALGVALYFLMVRMSWWLTGFSDRGSYNSLSSMWNPSDGGLFSLLKQAYINPIRYFLFPETHNARLAGAAGVVLVVFSLLCAFVLLKSKSLPRCDVAFLICCVVVMPLSLDIMYVATGGMQHALMVFQYSLWILAPMMVLDICARERELGGLTIGWLRASMHWSNSLNCGWVVGAVSGLLVGFVVFSNVVYANQVYLKKDLEYEATQSLIVRLVDRMEQVADYDPGVTPVVFVGDLASNDVLRGIRSNDFPPLDGQEPFRGSMSADSFTDYASGLGGSLSMGHTGNLGYYFYNVMGYPVKIASSEDIRLLKQSAEYAAMVEAMRSFPAHDSLAMFDNHLVVKLSE